MASFPRDVDLRKVELHVTGACTNRCVFCATGRRLAAGEPGREVPRAELRRQLEHAFAAGARRVLFQGGEPTLRRDLGDLLADAREVGFAATSVFTNARAAASPAGARALAALGATWLQVSIHAGDAAGHDAATGRRGAFAQTIAGTRRLLDAGQRVKVSSVLTRHLLASLPGWACLLEELRPEEVGVDALKPVAADAPGAYADLCPPLAPHAGRLRDAVCALDAAGVVTRLTSFPPCLVPGAEQLVADEAATVVTVGDDGTPRDKHARRRGLQVKAPGCARCAYDATCGGVYRAYAEAYGLGELSPRAARVPSPGAPPEARGDSPLTLRLRALLVREGDAAAPVRAVRELADGTHELVCGRPDAPVVVELAPAGTTPAYAATARFAVRYRNAPGGRAPDLRAVDAAVRELRRVEAALGPAEPA